MCIGRHGRGFLGFQRTLAITGVIATLAGGVAAKTTAAQVPAARRVVSFEDLIEAPRLAGAEISPDGRRIVYALSQSHLDSNTTTSAIWLVPTDGGAPSRLSPGPNDARPSWSPDGRQIAFSCLQHRISQVCLLPAEGGESLAVTNLSASLRGFTWAPDGRSLAITVPSEERAGQSAGDSTAQVVGSQGPHTRILSLDLGSRKTRVLVEGDFTAASPTFSPDGKTLVYVRLPSARADDAHRSDLWSLDLESGSHAKLVENDGPDYDPVFSPDGSRIAFLTASDPRSGLLKDIGVAMLPRSGGKARRLAPELDQAPEELLWPGEGRTLYIAAPVGPTGQLFAVSMTDGGAALPLTSVRGEVASPSFSEDGSRLAFALSEPERPSELYVWEPRRGGKPVQLTHHNAELGERARGRVELLRWKSRDGTQIEGILTHPVDAVAGRRAPLRVIPRATAAGNSLLGFHSDSTQAWAGRGWAVFEPNTRGSQGYGRSFLQAAVGDWGGADYDDMLSGVESLVARGIADPARMVLTGWASGGYMGALTLTRSEAFKAVVVGSPLVDLASLYWSTDIPSTLEAYLGGDPWTAPEAYRRRSPVNQPIKGRTPTLILHGLADVRVPLGQSRALYLALRRAAVPVTYVTYAREGTFFREPRNRLDRMRREYDFCAEHALG
ncbi:MAG: S9 family peptidase, partial [Vicinamibacteria bacterium]|nr:S9 family peptidase [Vicinamibacteria bacterium]